MSGELTRSGVAYDLSVSPHEFIVKYDNEDITYIFSSELYRNIFLKKIEENRKKINESLSKRFGYTIENNKLCDLQLYSKTEKRGFLLKTEKESFECLNIIKLDGNNLIIKS
jgi:hypothetical protein